MKENRKKSDVFQVLVFRHFGAIGAGIVLLVSFILPAGADSLPSFCPIFLVSGVTCPGCGLSRSIVNISHGEWATAFSYHPFGYVFYVLLLLVIADPVLVRCKLLRKPILTYRRVIFLFVFLLISMTLHYYAFRFQLKINYDQGGIFSASALTTFICCVK